MKQTYQTLSHTFQPFYQADSKILILGSFPSVKSREEGFYYGHPRNRFYQVLATVFNDTLPSTIGEKQQFLKRNHIAVWDVIDRCDIIGSKDSSIKNVVPSDINRILIGTQITHIYVNGKTAYRLYQKYLKPTVSLPVTELPSTSPANAMYSLERLVAAWSVIDMELHL